MKEPINIVFDGPPGAVAGRFVEVESDQGRSISIGEWKKRKDGYWVLRITELPEHIHDWTEWSYEVSPTGRRTCRKCGKIDID